MIRFSLKPVQESWRERGRRGLYAFFKLKLGDFEFEVSNGSLQPWAHFRWHQYDYSTHFVVGKISLSYGCPGLAPMTVCADCFEEIQRVGAYGDSLSYCESCQQVEGNTIQVATKEYEARRA